MNDNLPLYDLPKFDKIIHERARLMILSYLVTNMAGRAAFNKIKEDLEFSSGNLSVQLKNLEEAGYVAIEKSFKNNKPLTEVILTKKGDDALQKYLEEMERLIGTLKEKNN